MYGFIYLTTNKINNKKYIGKRVIRGRADDCSYLGSGVLLKEAIAKYGVENFERDILEWCHTENSLNLKEQMYIKAFKAVESEEFYNLIPGGTGGNTRFGKTEDELAEWHNKISIGNSGKTMSDELKSKHKKRMSSDSNPCLGKYGEEHPRFGYRLSNEEIDKMKQGRKEKIYNQIKVVLENKEVLFFESQKECVLYFKSSNETIRKIIKSGKPYKRYRNIGSELLEGATITIVNKKDLGGK